MMLEHYSVGCHDLATISGPAEMKAALVVWLERKQRACLAIKMQRDQQQACVQPGYNGSIVLAVNRATKIILDTLQHVQSLIHQLNNQPEGMVAI